MKGRKEGSYRLGCDIGGTFTDFYLLDVDTGESWQEKQLTTPDNPVDGVMLGITKLEKKVGRFMPRVNDFVHGTTLVINAVIERKGAKTALITTHGFRDILEMRLEERYEQYNLSPKWPKPLVPRYLRKGVDERTNADGLILRKVNKNGLYSILDEFLTERVESVAVCLLHSYVNPNNERVIGEVVGQKYPELYISLSSDVIPKIKEYQRTSTTVVNAYAKPKVNKYLTELSERIESIGYKGKMSVMLSGGGVISAEMAKSYPVRIIESGPIGGVVASEFYGATKGMPNLIAFDMGGTTAKLCLIKDFNAIKVDGIEIDRADRFKKGSGIPLEVPFVDIAEIGAGGGSIAFCNNFGLLQVGPESTGAKPGPACYGLGGDKATVTDADLVLGYLDKDYFLGGEMEIYPEKAEESLQRNVASKLGMTLIQAARGIHDVVNENMANTARVHAIEKGYNPSDFVLIAYGGAGPVHAFGVARKLKISRVLIPVSAGVESAFGFLVAPPSIDLVRTYKNERLEEVSLLEVETIFKEMEERACEMLTDGTQRNVEFNRALDMSYMGQGYELRIPIPGNRKLDRANLLGIFNERYRTLYGHIYEEVGVRIVNLMVRATVAMEKIRLPRMANDISMERSIKGKRKAFCIDRGEFVDFNVYDRYHLPSGANFDGPAIIEERESTIVVGSLASVSVDEDGVINISLK